MHGSIRTFCPARVRFRPISRPKLLSVWGQSEQKADVFASLSSVCVRLDPTCHSLLFCTWPTTCIHDHDVWGENGVVALRAASLCGLCPAFVLPISTPYGQNPDKMGIDLGSCGGVGLPPLWTVWPWLATRTMSADASAAGRRRGADCVLYFYPNGDYAKIPWPHMS